MNNDALKCGHPGIYADVDGACLFCFRLEAQGLKSREEIANTGERVTALSLMHKETGKFYRETGAVWPWLADENGIPPMPPPGYRVVRVEVRRIR